MRLFNRIADNFCWLLVINKLLAYTLPNSVVLVSYYSSYNGLCWGIIYHTYCCTTFMNQLISEEITIYPWEKNNGLLEKRIYVKMFYKNNKERK